MGSRVRGSEIGTTNGRGRCAVQALSGVTSDVRWFAAMAQAEHPDKPGTILHTLTGVNERLCQKYAAGKVRPSSSFLRALLRTENGWNYLDHVMHGSTAPWWVELQACLASLSQFVK